MSTPRKKRMLTAYAITVTVLLFLAIVQPSPLFFDWAGTTTVIRATSLDAQRVIARALKRQRWGAFGLAFTINAPDVKRYMLSDGTIVNYANPTVGSSLDGIWCVYVPVAWNPTKKASDFAAELRQAFPDATIVVDTHPIASLNDGDFVLVRSDLLLGPGVAVAFRK